MVSVFKNEGITFEVNGNLEHRLPHVLNVSFTGMNIEPFLVNLDLAGIAVSSGSACTAGSIRSITCISSDVWKRLRSNTFIRTL